MPPYYVPHCTNLLNLIVLLRRVVLGLVRLAAIHAGVLRFLSLYNIKVSNKHDVPEEGRILKNIREYLVCGKEAVK